MRSAFSPALARSWFTRARTCSAQPAVLSAAWTRCGAAPPTSHVRARAIPAIPRLRLLTALSFLSLDACTARQHTDRIHCPLAPGDLIRWITVLTSVRWHYGRTSEQLERRVGEEVLLPGVRGPRPGVIGGIGASGFRLK